VRDFTLLVVIVNYRRAAMTLDCLDTAVPEVRGLSGGCRIAVCDNADDAGNNDVAELSRGVADRGWGDVVTLVASESNLGFAGGNNHAIREATRDATPAFVMLLNNDTLVRPGAFATLLSFMAEHPRCGIVGSRLEWPDERPQRSAFRFHSVWSELESGAYFGPITQRLSRSVVALEVADEAHRADWVSGASSLIRWRVIEEVGLLDESFFMYFEEVLYNWQARRAGWETWYAPAARVVHLKGQTSGVTRVGGPPRPRPAFWYASRRRFFLKSRGVRYAMAADAAKTLGLLIHAVLGLVQRDRGVHPPGTLRMMWRQWLSREGAA